MIDGIIRKSPPNSWRVKEARDGSALLNHCEAQWKVLPTDLKANLQCGAIVVKDKTVDAFQPSVSAPQRSPITDKLPGRAGLRVGSIEPVSICAKGAGRAI